MTREETKEIFINRGFVNGIFDGDKWRQSIVVISEWLQSNSDEDCISRKEVIKAIDKHTFETDDGVCLDDDITCILEDISSIQPKAKTGWIPVSERYPKIEDECKYFLVTDDKGKVSVQKFLLSLEEEPQPYFSGMINVIAWMPLPEPYKAESEDKE